MGLILRSIERMLKMQFSMARNFTLQPLRLLQKQHKRNFMLDTPCLQKAKQQRLGANHVPLDLQPETLPMRHIDTYFKS